MAVEGEEGEEEEEDRFELLTSLASMDEDDGSYALEVAFRVTKNNDDDLSSMLLLLFMLTGELWLDRGYPMSHLGVMMAEIMAKVAAIVNNIHTNERQVTIT